MIRAFEKRDKPHLLALIRLLIPDHFHPSEELDFSEYLDHKAEHYFVFEKEDEILGCGGYNYQASAPGEVRISWDMVHPEHHGKGIGKSLTNFRLDKIRQQAALSVVTVRTSQFAFRFYAQFGFSLKETQRDYWAPGFDLYHMEMKV